MKWPVGKYNGRRIVGITFKIVLDVTEWRWIPTIGHDCGMFHWLCWRSWTEATYEDHYRARDRLKRESTK